MRDIHQKQLDEMDIRLSNAKQSETVLIDELAQLKTQYITKMAEYEKEKNRVQELEKQIVAISQSLTESQHNEVNTHLYLVPNTFNKPSSIFFILCHTSEITLQRVGNSKKRPQIVLSIATWRAGAVKGERISKAAGLRRRHASKRSQTNRTDDSWTSRETNRIN